MDTSIKDDHLLNVIEDGSTSLKDVYPLGVNTSVEGNRRLVREKVLQILIAKEVCETSLKDLFDHIFYRVFNFGDDEADLITPKKLLQPSELLDIEGDYPIIWKNEYIEFGRSYINFYGKEAEATDAIIKEFADNWSVERIAKIDRLLIHMAVVEFLYFPDIPLKVSMNEIIEIAKLYSTDKSNSFINGLLEKIRNKLTQDGKLTKEVSTRNAKRNKDRNKRRREKRRKDRAEKSGSDNSGSDNSVSSTPEINEMPEVKIETPPEIEKDKTSDAE